MTALWPYFLRPFWLLALPLLAWLLWRLWQRRRQIGRWQRILPPAFHAVLLTPGRRRNRRLPWLALGLAWLLAWLALLGPSWQRLEQPSLKRADPLVILLELTPAMLAGDLPPTRLEQARRKLSDLLEHREDAQTAVVVFAGSAHTLVPLSDDRATTLNLLQALKPSIMPEPGHRADLAVARGLALLEQGGQNHGRLLLIGTSLDDTERAGIRQLLRHNGQRLAILGVGTAEGAPIREDGGAFLKDEQGSILIPRLDGAALQQFASELGGRYRQARLDDDDLAGLGLLDAQGALRQHEELTRLDVRLDQGHWLLLPLLLLAACAGRRGWLFCLPLCLLLPVPAQAFGPADLWLRPDQQGQRLLQAQRPDAAARLFRDPQWQGYARYLAGDYAGAAEAFAQGDSAEAHYNRGNALARSEAFEAAIEAYDQALELQPELMPAQRNKELLEGLLRQLREQPPQAHRGQPLGQTEQDAVTGGAAAAGDAPPSLETKPANEGGKGDDGEPDVSQPAADVEKQPQRISPPGERSAPQASELERRQAIEQWLRQVPDEPDELLRRKFLHEQRQRQDMTR